VAGQLSKSMMPDLSVLDKSYRFAVGAVCRRSGQRHDIRKYEPGDSLKPGELHVGVDSDIATIEKERAAATAPGLAQASGR
jgi:hypothetical protein